jgi:hypothetical protein
MRAWDELFSGMDAIVNHLDDLGSDGWEVTGAVPINEEGYTVGIWIFLRRETVEEADADDYE